MMDLTSPPCPERPHQFHQRAVAVHIAGGNDIRDGENVAIDVIRTQTFTAIDRLGADERRLAKFGNDGLQIGPDVTHAGALEHRT